MQAKKRNELWVQLQNLTGDSWEAEGMRIFAPGTVAVKTFIGSVVTSVQDALFMAQSRKVVRVLLQDILQLENSNNILKEAVVELERTVETQALALDDYRDFSPPRAMPECDHYWQVLSSSTEVEELICTKCMAKQVADLKPACGHFWVAGMHNGVSSRFCVTCHAMEVKEQKDGSNKQV